MDALAAKAQDLRDELRDYERRTADGVQDRPHDEPLHGSDADRPDLVRYWFTFEVEHLAPEPGPPGTIILDGGTLAYRYFGLGAGVTGYDEADCIALIESTLEGEPVPPVRSRTRDVDVETLDLPRVGVPVWRGIWYPAFNLSGPAAQG